jgi:hypothetical protein
MILCNYGCGQEAKYHLKNGKWCCSEKVQSCIGIRRKIRNSVKGYTHTEETKKKLSDRLKGRYVGSSNPMYGKKRIFTKETRKKISEGNKGKIVSKETRMKISSAFKGCKSPTYLTINKIKKKYSFFSRIEEMRYNPDKPGEKEIQVHCKNHNCPNSKEKNGWFTPTYAQLYERMRALERPYGMIENNFYCSQECKCNCSLYRKRDGVMNNQYCKKLYTLGEYNIWRDVVLKQDNYECQKCGAKEDLHCHHIHPVKTHPHLVLDPDNGIVLCKNCHYKVGHKSGSECDTYSLSRISC